MKTLTAQIDVINVTAKKDGTYIVEYWDEAHEGENNVTMQISEESLFDHIETNFFNYDPHWNTSTYFDDNKEFVIKDYITANS